MLSHGCDMRRWPAAMAGLALGLFAAVPAQAFAPLSGPILTASAVPPNVLVLFDNSSSMVLNAIGNETRLDIARDVTKDVIAANRGVRFGLFSFRQSLPNDSGPGDSCWSRRAASISTAPMALPVSMRSTEHWTD